MEFFFNPSFLFVCGSCREAFPNINDLTKHKVEYHFETCVGLQCIVFEETTWDLEDWNKSKLTPEVRSSQFRSTGIATSQQNECMQDHCEWEECTPTHGNANAGLDDENTIPTIEADRSTVVKTNASVADIQVIEGEPSINDNDALGIDKLITEHNSLNPSPVAENVLASNSHLSESVNLDPKPRSEIPKPFECPICSECFDTRAAKAQHLDAHDTLAKKFICNCCHARFKTRGQRRRHRLMHRMACPEECRFCGASFSFKSDLASHERIHIGKHFKCDTINCCFVTKRRTVLIRHMKNKHPENYINNNSNNSDESAAEVSVAVPSSKEMYFDTTTLQQDEIQMPFVCQACASCFGSETCLERHVDIHCMSKPLTCPHCPVKFERRREILAHVTIHGRDSADRCNFCCKAYCNKARLR